MTSSTAGWARIASRKESRTIHEIEASGNAARRLAATGTERQTSPRALGRMSRILVVGFGGTRLAKMGLERARV
jgi:hypothetical protein